MSSYRHTNNDRFVSDIDRNVRFGADHDHRVITDSSRIDEVPSPNTARTNNRGSHGFPANMQLDRAYSRSDSSVPAVITDSPKSPSGPSVVIDTTISDNGG